MKNVNKSSQKTALDATRVDFFMKKDEDQERIDTDPYGSYTGVPSDPFDEPVQDADDL